MATPDWLYDAVFYQIFPERFARSEAAPGCQDCVSWDSEPTRDNFFGGDLRGIGEHLDHLCELGVNALYLTPIFQAHTNHRYDAEDYFSIDRRLGSLDDFDALISLAHRRGMRVVLDGVFNHCGKTHPYFHDVVANEECSEYVDWFYVEDFPVRSEPEPNYRTCSGCEYLPKWNVHHPDVRNHHLDVGRYWIDRGIDGWRLDVPYFINMNFWRRFCSAVKAKGEELYIVAEEWRDPEQWLMGDTADGTMNYTLRDLILGFTADRRVDAHSFAEAMTRLSDRIPQGFHHGMLNLLGSHDTERVLTRHKGNVDNTLLAFDMMYACIGAPMVYYGDEIGMRGENDPACRGAMIWDEEKWNHRIYQRIVDLGQIRRDNISLRRGDQEVLAIDEDTVLIMRRHERQDAAVIIHRGEGTRIGPDALPTDGRHGWVDVVAGEVCHGDIIFASSGSLFLVREE